MTQGNAAGTQTGFVGFVSFVKTLCADVTLLLWDIYEMVSLEMTFKYYLVVMTARLTDLTFLTYSLRTFDWVLKASVLSFDDLKAETSQQSEKKESTFKETKYEYHQGNSEWQQRST